MPNTAARTALSLLVRSVGWACTTYTLMQVIGGKLSGPPLLGLIGGSLMYGLGLFAFGLYQRGRAGSPR